VGSRGRRCRTPGIGFVQTFEHGGVKVKTGERHHALDRRASGWSTRCDPDAARARQACLEVAAAGAGPVGLADGERPLADVEVLAGAMAACEYALAVRLHAAEAGGAVPFPTPPGGMLSARGWSRAAARRLARCGALAASSGDLAAAWAAGVITSEHVEPVARLADRFTAAELDALIVELRPHWGLWTPSMIARFVAAADRMLHPPPEPTPDERDAHEARFLSFALTPDGVVVAGELPRVEGELVMAALDSIAERLRSTADHVPAGARRADALVQLVNDAHGAAALPTRGGLPVGVTVTLDRTEAGDPTWVTSRGHLLTRCESRWAACDAALTPVVLTERQRCGAHGWGEDCGSKSDAPSAAALRIAALAASMFDTRLPLAVGRTQRTATAAQRRSLAVRDRGCIIPGCDVHAEACQTHHLDEWATGGTTDLDNLVLLCWAHHRQVDLHLWTIEPGRPASGGEPPTGAPPGTAWPANNGAPFTVTRVARGVWRN
jgi:hypothetical protein